MNEDYIENEKHSNRNYWIGFFGLVIVGIFIPERYSTLIFLLAIFCMLFEISDRLRREYYLHQQSLEYLRKIADKQ